ncbi:concanavalin A-like lectin/glucanase domain-containing protein [Phakopsora pachyrhizi]|uniref:Concanavalin A-like lectin/glucanase domain-containing protein n=1 Tax=Phakopsora pachyrhizi TaxID=170000 RepID=A0A0S1MIQ1_PHAPC|nr:concanavalin A-like lectin/glucanase domain-containing protein [Phakopsora pachyrhizi]CAH7669030.1 concanavalin A-like lectin/glucanase domain-containing protein [Phakopsora pachyrhizi]CAH7672378.1 concanavalin A-like lectin/glucanase domain-containing protein [Phakopsora pachyrhizi]
MISLRNGLTMISVLWTISNLVSSESFHAELSVGNHQLLSTRSYSNYSNSWRKSQTISGSSFFDHWEFQERWDSTTHGAAYYVNREDAQRLKLAYVDENHRAILAVDSKTDLSNDTMPSVLLNTTDGTHQVNPLGLRKSVRIESIKTYDFGSLIIADFYHVPQGCASWGAFWMYGSNWPYDGEVDILEGFNDNIKNIATLHTTANCSHDPSGNQIGKVLQESCDISINYNAGCSVQDTSLETYGSEFNKRGGGVYATVYTKESITVWRWTREEIPKDITEDKPDPNTWGTPVATWLNGDSCRLSKHFKPQNLVFTITTCGDADRETYKQTKCPGSSCFDHLLKGSNYKDVYFSVNSIKIFKN